MRKQLLCVLLASILAITPAMAETQPVKIGDMFAYTFLPG